MGYQPPRNTYVLVFDDPAMEGLEVKCRSVPVRTFTGLIRLAAADNPSGADMAEIDRLFNEFGKALVSWNVTETDDDGKERLDDNGDAIPVPPTREGVDSQDVDWAMNVAFSWLQAIGGVPAPLDGRSTAGARSVELSLPMAPSSPSPPS